MTDEKLHEKIDKIAEDIVDLKVIAVKLEENLKYHILRTDLAEENIKLLRKEIQQKEDELRILIKPIEKHVQYVDVGLKIAGGLFAITSFLVGLFEVYKLWH